MRLSPPLHQLVRIGGLVLVASRDGGQHVVDGHHLGGRPGSNDGARDPSHDGEGPAGRVVVQVGHGGKQSGRQHRGSKEDGLGTVVEVGPRLGLLLRVERDVGVLDDGHRAEIGVGQVADKEDGGADADCGEGAAQRCERGDVV